MTNLLRSAFCVAVGMAAAYALSQSGQGQGNNQGYGNNDRNHQGNGGQSDYRSHSRQSQSQGQSQSQTASYGSSSNHYQPSVRQQIQRAPQVHPNSPDFRRLAANRDFENLYGPYARRGYWGYSANWTDNNFFFGAYVFDPYVTVGCISPWYYYPFLPGYISTTSVTYSFGTLGLQTYVGIDYPWFVRRHHHRVDGGYAAGFDEGYAAGAAAASSQIANNDVLNAGLNDLVTVFEQKDINALNRIVPQDGTVGIYVDGVFQYGVSADGFYDLLKDNANTSRTVRYDVLNVQFNATNQARVIAAHDYIDPWGQEQTVYHTYLLQVNRRGVQVLEFGTSQSRPR